MSRKKIIAVIILLILLSISTIKKYQKYKIKNQAEKYSPKCINVENNSLDKLRIKYNNNDIIAVLQIANLNVIVVQGTDNKYYLNHLINKESNPAGSIFLDYREKINTAKQLNIYGHSSDYYELPFNTLMNYMDKDYYKNNKYATLITDDKTYRYEIFSVIKTQEEEHLVINFKDDKEYYNHLKYLQEKSLYNTTVNINTNDDIMIIQTCIINDPMDSLLIINLRKVGEE